MSKVDDELTRRLRGAEREVEVDGLFEGLERRRTHRRRVRRVQAGTLAVVVLIATAAAFAALTNVFGTQATDIGHPTPLPANGEIVLSVAFPEEGSTHLFAIRPDDQVERQITDLRSKDTDPAVSPDGRAIAFVQQLEGEIPGIATISIDGGDITRLTDDSVFVTSGPTWSPDGTRLAFAAHDDQGQRLLVMNADGSGLRAVTTPELYWVAGAAWSPDGTQIAFAASTVSGDVEPSRWDLYAIEPEGAGLVRITHTPTPEADESSPTWSPDGERLVFARSDTRGAAWLVLLDLSNGVETRLTDGSFVDVSPSWSPDGTTIAFDRAPVLGSGSDVWSIRPDGSALTQTTEGGGFSPSWQPIPAETVQPTPEPQPSPRASAGPDGYGFGIDICPQHVTWVKEQLDGIGAEDWAFAVIERGADGACPPASPVGYLGVDLDQDQLVDVTYGPIRCEIDCIAFAAPDLDGDGRHEILLAESPGSIFRIGVYAVSPAGTPSNDKRGIVRIEVGEPDLPDAGFITGEPARLSIGGDEGWSYRLRCVDRPEGRFLIASSAFHEVDSDGPVRINEATLAYGERRMIVVDATDRAEAFSADPLGPQPEELCGTTIPQV